MESYRPCFVPTCNNDSKNSSKIIVRIPEDLREKWCREVKVEYFKVYVQYCCEDHFDPKEDLLNYNYKSEKQEPRLKPTAKLRNIIVNVPEKVSSGSQAEESILAKLLSQTQQERPTEKRKYVVINLPSASGAISSQPFKFPGSSSESSTNTNRTDIQHSSASTGVAVHTAKMNSAHYSNGSACTSNLPDQTITNPDVNVQTIEIEIEKLDDDGQGAKENFPDRSSDRSTDTDRTNVQHSSIRTDVSVDIPETSAHYSMRPVLGEKEPPTKRRCQQDFCVQVNRKTAREIKLIKANKLLQQTAERQKHKIKNMSNIIENLLDVYHKSVD